MRPCNKIEYLASMNLGHQNSRKLMKYTDPNASQHLGVWVRYDDFVVQEQREFFILDESGLVASIGGFLGMFLGFSTLTIGQWVHQKIYH